MTSRLRPSILVQSAKNPFGLGSNCSKTTHSPPKSPSFQALVANMSSNEAMSNVHSPAKLIDSHLHVWASPQEATEKFPYFPGQEPTLAGHADILLECMEEAGIDGALIVQPINHKFDHSYVTSILKRYPSKFSGCCLANPADDGSGIEQLEDLVSKDGYCAVRFNPYLWPSGQKGLNMHFSEIEELCTEYPSTPVLIDHMGFCKPPTNDDESPAFSNLLKLSRFPQVYVKFSALFRISREPFPYQDLSSPLSQVVSSFGANRIMWGSDFPFVVSECGYKAAKEAVSLIAKQADLSPSELNWIMGGTIMKLFQGHWLCT
ncbi:uncharacterized protein LOC104897520 isoform X2 [Beta vulgaris subsp. vulgaris]|uniref:uncharacterized protein LOC104897520 isoform X2 n=1 Tax=Beta vulgaris subsp. vulgaris TaxID=3555 RepID=UPI002036B1CB|nr:uncharacterized protein LOC104897520 isoform X2 [Beta vulgaris subsp. vulgaris]